MGERGVVLKGGYPLRFMERLKSQEMKRATKIFFSFLALPDLKSIYVLFSPNSILHKLKNGFPQIYSHRTT
jgi:hypothetical protein